jgi:hypothetical protein
VTTGYAADDRADLEAILNAARRLSRSPDVYVRGGMTRIVAIVTATLRNASTEFTDRALAWEGPQPLAGVETVGSNPETEKGFARS